MKSTKRATTKTSAKKAALWHGIDFNHPIISLQNTHPLVFVMLLLGIYFSYIALFATIAEVISHFN